MGNIPHIWGFVKPRTPCTGDVRGDSAPARGGVRRQDGQIPCGLRDRHPEFAKAGAVLWGVTKETAEVDATEVEIAAVVEVVGGFGTALEVVTEGVTRRGRCGFGWRRHVGSVQGSGADVNRAAAPPARPVVERIEVGRAGLFPAAGRPRSLTWAGCPQPGRPTAAGPPPYCGGGGDPFKALRGWVLQGVCHGGDPPRTACRYRGNAKGADRFGPCPGRQALLRPSYETGR